MECTPIFPFLKGCGTGACLIIAIGAQNAFVLKQGIMKSHVFLVAILCSFIDAILIALGIGGLGKIITSTPYLINITKYGGAAFLFYYGFRSFYAALKSNNSLEIEEDFNHPSVKVTVLTLLAMSLLNPHVYLDTVVLLGSIGAQFEEVPRSLFAVGAMTASFIWFFSLAYGAGYLAPIFKKPIAWKILDTIVGVIMWGITISLLWPQSVCSV